MRAHPEFTVLLARQRTGTNALRSVLGSHPDIRCFGEVFELSPPPDADPSDMVGNYFTFLEQYCAGDVRRAFPNRSEELFTAYLAHLRGLTTKRLILVDVKYNSTHHVTGEWREIADPTLFQLLQRRQIGILQLTRRNLLRCLLSNLKAWQSQRYHVRDGQLPADERLQLDPPWTLRRLESWAAEDERVGAAFDGYPFYKRVDYVDLFPDATGAMDSTALLDLAGWFGVSNAFTNQASCFKMSSLPLHETIKNFAQLQKALQGTRFEHCFADEPAYRLQHPVAR